MSIFNFSKSVYNYIVEKVTPKFKEKYPNFKIVKNSLDAKYPQVVFYESRNQTIEGTIGNEITVKNIECKIEVYAKDFAIDDDIILANDIVDEIVEELVHILEKEFKITDIDVTENLLNFDRKNVPSTKTIINFSVKYIYEKKIYV